jgi:hypothetical protein
MSFRPDVELEPGQVKDVRGRGMGGRGGLAIGGGGLGLLALLLVYTLLGGDPADLAGVLPGGDAGANIGPENSTLHQCRTGADANRRQDCRILGYVNSIQEYWSDEFAASSQDYPEADTVLYTDAVSTGCGSATSQVGPFYCPNDQQVYIDLGFFDVLERDFGAQGGPFAEAYVLAHEYGHHIQSVTGTLQQGQADTGAGSTAVRIELMADCFAGLWANHAEATGFLQPLTHKDITEALSAAEAVGDDRIQQQVQGQVNPETWTHGSSDQRQAWFTTGYQKGTYEDCDTFNADLGP